MTLAKVQQSASSLLLALAIAGCGSGNGPADTVMPPPPVGGGFSTVTEERWDERAVRDVLHTFAYGGQASDAQIRIWADLPPATAIREMLNFDERNLKLSPPIVGDFSDYENVGGRYGL